MRISNDRLQELKSLLKKNYNLELSDEEAQQAGLAIIHFVELKQWAKNRQIVQSNGDYNGNKRDGKKIIHR